jgi:hypothetical protein
MSSPLLVNESPSTPSFCPFAAPGHYGVHAVHGVSDVLDSGAVFLWAIRILERGPTHSCTPIELLRRMVKW